MVAKVEGGVSGAMQRRLDEEMRRRPEEEEGMRRLTSWK
jgi:hypothetical protein